MSIKLITHSPDLQKLWDEGYSIQTIGTYLLVHGIAYVNSSKEIKRGTLVTTLQLAGDRTVKPDTHVMYFIGEQPCDKDGNVITAIKNDSPPPDTGHGIPLTLTFSAKDDYADYYDKVTRYVRILSAPALAIDPDVKVKLHEVIQPVDQESVFHYLDTNSSKAQINPISNKLSMQKIGIVGVGGTGSYVLDLVAKTPVKEIHLFDGDYFYQHNAFRAPGATPVEKFYEHSKKTDYFRDIYSNIHKHIFSHDYFITSENLQELESLTFVFVCMDAGEHKKALFDFLISKNIGFIDSGLGILDIDGSLKGQVRTVTRTERKNDHIYKRVSLAKPNEDLYDQNIQIADLNSLAATMAVIKWKKLLGFYKDHDQEFYSSYVSYTNETTNSDFPD